MFSAIVTLCVCCCSGTESGDIQSRKKSGLTILRAQCLLLMSLVVVVVNLVNLLILEVGEWRGFLTKEDQDFIEANGLEDMMQQGN